VTLEECAENIGKKVLYSAPPGEAEEGLLDSVGRKWAYVRYLRSPQPVATHPDYLVLMRGGSVAEHFRLELLDADIALADESDIDDDDEPGHGCHETGDL
jgi:hypothetical protein